MSWPEGGGLSPGSALEALENFLKLPCLSPIPRDSSLCVRGGPKPQDRFSSPWDFDAQLWLMFTDATISLGITAQTYPIVILLRTQLPY